MTFFFALIALGCSAHRAHTGLILEDQERILLVASSGKAAPLRLAGDSTALKEALGCRVQLEGPKLFGQISVQKWKIVDSGYGSEPFVGELFFSGSAWRIRDRNSQTWVELVVESMGSLTQHEGDLVLVDGFVLGPNLVKVVSFRVLRDF